MGPEVIKTLFQILPIIYPNQHIEPITFISYWGISAILIWPLKIANYASQKIGDISTHKFI